VPPGGRPQPGAGTPVDHDPTRRLASWRLLDVDALIAGLAAALRDHHARPTAGCPPRGDDELLAEARHRVGDGRVDPARFDPPYRRYAPEELLALAERLRPEPAAPPVLVHGDARLATVRVDGSGIRGWDPSPRTGAGDPYRDLATVAVDLAEQVGAESLGPFFAAYGIDHPDVRRVDFHVLVDQLLR